MEALPKDILADILSRLVVKHLLTCKCVSHAWYDLISDRSFVKLHQDHSRRIGSKQRVLYTRYPNSLHTADFDTFEGEAILDHPPLYAHSENAVVVGSCDGLLCLCELGRFNTRFELYNPTTRVCNILPWTPFEGNVELGYMLYFGFGYDAITDDYKVVRIAQTSEDPSDYFRCDARVYTLRTNTWKKVADVPYCLFRLHMYGILLNGALHFLASEFPDQNVPDKIVAFKLGDERFYSVPQPYFPQWAKQDDKKRWLTIGVLDGCLSQVDNYCSDDHHYGVWIMKEYGVQKSWSKMYNILFPEPIPMFNIGQEDPIPAGLRPISFSKDKKEIFFMVLFSHLISYDLENKTLHPVVHDNNQFVAWDMLVYEETLTSPLRVTNKADDHEETLDLPEDIITNILLRLPVKCLLRFKSVSWSWYDLITDSSFITRQVEWSRKTSSKLHIVYNNGSSFALRHAEFDPFDEDTSLEHPLIGDHHNTIVVGASDGLLCLCDLSTNHLSFPFALYNPTTGSSNVLPTSLLDGFSMDYEHFLGFGYDAANDDYKVVKIAQLSRRSEYSFCDYAQVYSLNTNSWKWVTTPPFRLARLQLYSGVCVNGVVHWISNNDNNERFDDAIAGFDIATETYSLVPQPQSLEPLLGRRCFLNLGVIDGCLCQVCNFLDHHFHDVWIMREYGVQSSWSKLFRIVNDEPGLEILKPKSFSSDKKELIFKGFHNYLVSYNVEEKKLRRCRGPESITWDAHIYEETLVSTDAGGIHWEEQDRDD